MDKHYKNDGVKRHPQIFNLQYSIVNSGPSGLGEGYEPIFSVAGDNFLRGPLIPDFLAAIRTDEDHRHSGYWRRVSTGAD